MSDATLTKMPISNVTIRSRKRADAPTGERGSTPQTCTDGPGAPSKPPYEVGYGRPPRKHQFRKGQSGNPRGRPPGAKGFKGQLRKVLSEPMQVKINGRTVYKSRQEIISLSLADKAARGDMKAIKLLIDLDPIAHEMLAKSASAAVEDVLDAEDDAMLAAYLRTLTGVEENDAEGGE